MAGYMADIVARLVRRVLSTSGGGRWRRGISPRRGCWLSGRRVASGHVGEGGGVVEVAAAESLGQRRSHRCRMARLSRVSDFDWPAGVNAMADSRPEPISAPFLSDATREAGRTGLCVVTQRRL